mmetsp:Transcript_12796/g.26093  ORF Transcript_12796/g.26093 Transcript_12796/m.26093 type:complete len:268 (+) Transcript_12796:11-814(+)
MPSKVAIAGAVAAFTIIASHAISAHAASASASNSTSPTTTEIEADVVVSIFNELSREMQVNVQKLVQMIQQIAQSGQQIPEAQLQMYVVQEYEKALTTLQEKVFASHSVSEEDVEEAVTYYLSVEHPGVTNQIKLFKQLYASIGGRPAMSKSVTMPTDVDLGKFCDILESYMGSMSSIMGDIVKEHRITAGIGDDGKFGQGDLERIRSKFSSTADDLSSKMLKDKYGIDQDQFTKLMEHYQAEGKVQQLVQVLGQKQNQFFRDLGIV